MRRRDRAPRPESPSRLPRRAVSGLDGQDRSLNRRCRDVRWGADREAGRAAMTRTRLVRGEVRKLTTTKMPWGFLAVLVVLAAIDGAVVMFGTDMDGSKAFIATAADQQSLMAFAFNAMLGAALFGAIAVAREYGHGTVVPTFLTSPRRRRAGLAQLAAVLVAGATLALAGQALVI